MFLYYTQNKLPEHKYYCWLDNTLPPFFNLHTLQEDLNCFRLDRSDCRRRADRYCWNSKTLKSLRFFLYRNNLSLPTSAPRKCRCSHRRICSSSLILLLKILIHMSWFIIPLSLSKITSQFIASTLELINTLRGSIELSGNPYRDSQ